MIPVRLLRKQRWIMAILFLLIIVMFVIGAGWGEASLPYRRILPTLLGEGTFKENFILYSIRLPRMVLCLLAGMALAMSGAILQSLTRNDLADPGILGINSGAGVAVTVMFIFVPLDAGSHAFAIPLAALIGALLVAGIIYGMAYDRSKGLHPVKLVLIGVGFSIALSGAMIVIISSVDYWQVDFIAKWLAGNLWGEDWPFILALLPWLVVLVPYALWKANRLDILTLGEATARSVGVSVERERILLMIAAVALAASAVSVTGGISFIGLMAPHIAKGLVGPRSRLHLPVAILIGGFLLLTAGTVGKNLTEPDGIPAGIMVALLGAPYFVYLLLRK
jgi:iron complex transport system permease protein